jgi:hypothetical protein
VIAQLWEWTVLRDERNRPVSICRTRQAAMAALSKALIVAGRPARGQVAQATLVRPVRQDALYVREAPQCTAVYDGSAVVWT